jgi:2-hydroxy-3-keto-5-methylthiopentenyl-1-phosphate phosphatase
MTDNYGFGYQKRRQGNLDMLDGTETFRDGFQKMVNSWTVSIPETISIKEAHQARSAFSRLCQMGEDQFCAYRRAQRGHGPNNTSSA